MVRGGWPTNLVEVLEGRPDDLHCLHQVLLRDDQRRREPNTVSKGKSCISGLDSARLAGRLRVHVHMRGLREHAPALEEQAQLPGGAARRAALLVDDDGVEQAAAPDLRHERGVERADRRAEFLAEDLRPLREALLHEDIEGGHRDGASEGVTVPSVSSMGRFGGRVGSGTHPPYVLPCSPGRMQSITSRSANTAETG